jgi:hypothetical protein
MWIDLHFDWMTEHGRPSFGPPAQVRDRIDAIKAHEVAAARDAQERVALHRKAMARQHELWRLRAEQALVERARRTAEEFARQERRLREDG